jgi:para-aminobenzoate synthetase/4-amino-4-deoxychorismate lyase
VTQALRVAPVRQALDFGARPDPAGGIFETILVTDGAAPLLGAQLERLRASASALYGVELGDELTSVPGEVPAGTARMRVSYVPGQAPRVDHGPRPPDPSYMEIAPFVLPGGLGPHKWLDRTLLDAITAAAGERALPLLLDEDGSVLESVRMNVLIEDHGRLISPPSDGRYRAGFGRTRLAYEEEPFDLERLLGAEAIILTSALRVVRVPLGRSRS